MLLGHDVRSGEAVELPDALRPRGLTVIGKTGTGKSTLLEQLLVADLRRGTPAVLIDPHGRLASRVMSLARPGADDRLILLEPWPDRPFRLNLLDCPDPDNVTALDRTVDHAVEVFKKLFDRSDEYLPRLERDLDAAIRTVIPNRGTLLDVLRVFGNPELRTRYRAAVTADAVQEYWDYFERLGREAEQVRQVEATVNRLYKLLAPQLIRRVVDTSTTTVPFDAVLAGDRMLLLSIPARHLTPQRCDFLGALFLGALTDRIFAREAGTADPPRLHLYIDEYARFATPMTAELFSEGRKYGVGLTVAHQTLAQVTDAAIRAAERQVGALVLFQLIGPDAEELAGELDTTPVRTKVNLRQRTAPQYAEWDEEVWDDPDAERAHAQAEAQLATLTETVGAALARRKAGYYLLDAAYRAAGASGFLGGFMALLAGPLPENSPAVVRLFRMAMLERREVHQPFNPKYLALLVEQGQTVGGLLVRGEPDFWDPDPAQPHTDPCEGYRLAQGEGFRPLRSRLAGELRRCVHGLSSNVLGDVIDKHGDDIKLAGSLQEIAADLERQVSAMLAEQYREAIFWFCPHTLERTLNKNHGELPEEVVDKLAAVEVWVAATTSKLGEERPVRMATRLGGAQCVERVETVVHDYQWPCLGWWQLTAFPQAVAWLTQWVRDAHRDIAALQTEWDEKRPALEERTGFLVQTYRRRVHRKKYLGDLPVKHERVLAPGRSEYSRVSGPYYVPPVTREDQWYDPVEELDQTHADPAAGAGQRARAALTVHRLRAHPQGSASRRVASARRGEH